MPDITLGHGWRYLWEKKYTLISEPEQPPRGIQWTKLTKKEEEVMDPKRKGTQITEPILFYKQMQMISQLPIMTA